MSLNAMFVFVSYRVLFFVFIHVKCHLIVFRDLIVLLIILCVFRNIFVSYSIMSCRNYFSLLVKCRI